MPQSQHQMRLSVEGIGEILKYIQGIVSESSRAVSLALNHLFRS